MVSLSVPISPMVAITMHHIAYQYNHHYGRAGIVDGVTDALAKVPSPRSRLPDCFRTVGMEAAHKSRLAMQLRRASTETLL
jgi:hypothetical protein